MNGTSTGPIRLWAPTGSSVGGPRNGAPVRYWTGVACLYLAVWLLAPTAEAQRLKFSRYLYDSEFLEWNYLESVDEEAITEHELSLPSASVLWSLEREGLSDLQVAGDSTLLIHDRRGAGRLTALDASTGIALWERHGVTKFGTADGEVVALITGPEAATDRLVVLSANDGAVRSEASIETKSWAVEAIWPGDPVVVTQKKRRRSVGWNRRLLAIDPASGEKLAKRRTSSFEYRTFESGGRVFTHEGDELLQLDRGKLSVELRISFPDRSARRARVVGERLVLDYTDGVWAADLTGRHREATLRQVATVPDKSREYGFGYYARESSTDTPLLGDGQLLMRFDEAGGEPIWTQAIAWAPEQVFESESVTYAMRGRRIDKLDRATGAVLGSTWGVAGQLTSRLSECVPAADQIAICRLTGGSPRTRRVVGIDLGQTAPPILPEGSAIPFLKALRAGREASHFDDDSLISEWERLEGLVLRELAPEGLPAADAETALRRVVELSRAGVLSGRMTWRAAERLTRHRVREGAVLPEITAVARKAGVTPAIVGLSVGLDRAAGHAKRVRIETGWPFGLDISAQQALKEWTFRLEQTGEAYPRFYAFAVFHPRHEHGLIITCGPRKDQDVCVDSVSEDGKKLTRCVDRESQSACHDLAIENPLAVDLERIGYRSEPISIHSEARSGR